MSKPAKHSRPIPVEFAQYAARKAAVEDAARKFDLDFEEAWNAYHEKRLLFFEGPHGVQATYQPEFKLYWQGGK